jgi:hypothetical protein|tara:strand:- start:4283 stop:4519 length:237 start_codon:yes stop_codon:yes gene_type:complete
MRDIIGWRLTEKDKSMSSIKERKMPCPECDGHGQVEVEYAVPHNINRDVGYLDTRLEDCEYCNGYGDIEDEGFEDLDV